MGAFGALFEEIPKPERKKTHKTILVVWKSLNVPRIFDEDSHTLIYIAHASEVQNGSAKISISTVPLFDSTSEHRSAYLDVSKKNRIISALASGPFGSV